MPTSNEVKAKAKELEATNFATGINWHWARGFPTEDEALKFVKWLETNKLEHRGVYPPYETDTTWAVRYRW